MKEHIKDTLRVFFTAVTLINLAMFILGSNLQPDHRFGYEVFIYPIIYGAIGCIPNLIFYTKKEMTLKQAIIRNILQMLMIAGLIVGFIFGSVKFTAQMLPQVIGVTVSVIVIYIIVTATGWIFDTKTAIKMTEDLKRYQEKAASKDI